MTGFLHSCHHAGCLGHAVFGRGVHLLRGQSGAWSCRDHLWPDYLCREAEAAPVKESFEGRRPVTLPPATYQPQGQLL